MTHSIKMTRIDALKPYARNARTHSKKQIRQIAESIRRFGFTNPVLISDEMVIIAGHGRVEAAKLLGMIEVPCIRLSHLSETEVKAYVLADNRLAEKAGWDKEVLALELQGLIDLKFDIELTGFEIAEADIIIGEANEANPDEASGPENDIPEPAAVAVTRPGDIWSLGRHRLLCGDARDGACYAALMSGEQADMVFTDAPYNVRIDGHVSGGGRTKHREFAMASGEMSKEAFTAFLAETHKNMASVCRDGAIVFSCMDWRHLPELLAAGDQAFSEFKQLCVWVKTNAGQGAFYRSKHELVLVFKVGEAAHTNTFGLGDTGRYRTNVWTYAGVNTFKRGRMDELGMHPTVKPVAMVEDAIRDVTRRGEVVLDPFGGSGTTLISAEKCGRRARLIELDPLYCDVIVRRWQAYTGKAAVRPADGLTFEDAAAQGASGMEAA